MKLNIIRKKIDIIDIKILNLLAKRFKLAQKAGIHKKIMGIPLEDKKREDELINNQMREAVKIGISKTFINHLFKLIIKESKSIQRKINL